MPRISRILFLLAIGLAIAGIVGSSADLLAKDKKKKEPDPKKEDKKEPKKEEKIEKKDPFKPDAASQEFKYEDKDKTFWVYGVAFAADGKTVAAVYRDYSIKIWDLGAKKDIQTIKGKTPDVKGLGDFKSILYVKDQIYVGTGQWNVKKKERAGEVKVFDAKAGKPGKAVAGHAQDVVNLAVSRDGKQLATASADNTVKIWDFPTLKETKLIKGHGDELNSVAFSPDGAQVVTTSKDKTLRVWNIADAKEVANFKVEREVEVKDPKAKDPKAKGKMVKELGREFTCAIFSADGKKIIAGNLDGVIKVYDVVGKKEIQELKAHDGIWALVLNPDGSKFASGGYDGTIKIWDAVNGKELKTIKAHVGNDKTYGGTVTSLSFSPDGAWLASGGIDGVVKIWNAK